MASSYLPLPLLFGDSAQIVGSGETAVLSVKLSELGITNAESVSAEGLILGFLQHWNQSQGTEATRLIDITRDGPFQSMRATENALAERFVTKVFHVIPKTPLRPSDI